MLIGDAAGYVEPFTGEGIAWAILSGATVAPLALAICAQEATPQHATCRWQAAHRQLLRGRKRNCWLVTRLLRSPRLTTAAIAALQMNQHLARPFMRQVYRPAQVGLTCRNNEVVA